MESGSVIDRKLKVSPIADDSDIVEALARDLRSGKIDGKLTYPMVKTGYDLRVDKRIRRVFVQLENMGLIQRNGRSFYNVTAIRKQIAA